MCHRSQLGAKRMRLISEVASILVIGVILTFHGVILVNEDDTEIIRTFMELGWERTRSPDPQPFLAWAQWCKAGMQLGEWGICPRR